MTPYSSASSSSISENTRRANSSPIAKGIRKKKVKRFGRKKFNLSPRKVTFADESGKSNLCDYNIIEVSPKNGPPTSEQFNQNQPKRLDRNITEVPKSVNYNVLLEKSPQICNKVVKLKISIIRKEKSYTSPVICSQVMSKKCSFFHQDPMEVRKHIQSSHPKISNVTPIRVVHFPRSIVPIIQGN